MTAATQLIRGDEHAVYMATRPMPRKACATDAGRRRHRRRPDVPGGPQQAAETVARAGSTRQSRRSVPPSSAFGIMKLGYGFRRVRYIGLVRNACHLHLLCTAINLKRALALAGLAYQVCPEHKVENGSFAHGLA